MQILKNTPNPQNTELTTLNTEETVLIKNLVQNVQRLRAIHEENFSKEWLYVMLKVSLAMNNYFSECADERLQARYACCMEVFSDFVDFAGNIDSEILYSVHQKMK